MLIAFVTISLSYTLTSSIVPMATVIVSIILLPAFKKINSEFFPIFLIFKLNLHREEGNVSIN